MKNSLSAPVEILLKSSNIDRFEIEPKQKKLAPFESFTIDVVLKMTKYYIMFINICVRPNGQQSQKYKEHIFIKSDFFDQKVTVVIIPGQQQNAQVVTPRGELMMMSQSLKQSQGKQHRREQSENNRTNSQSNASQELNKEAEVINQKEQVISELNQQLKDQQSETSNALNLLRQEQIKRKEQEQKCTCSLKNDNEDYLAQIKQLLKEKEPNLEILMNLSLKKEREQQERKDSKVLEILKIKDQQILELQAKCSQQEGEYGQLAQMFQELKKKLRENEQIQESQEQKCKLLDDQLSSSKQKIESFEKGKEYLRMLETEDRLKEAQQVIDQYQQQLYCMSQQLQDKQHLDQFYEEALQRYKEQLLEKEAVIKNANVSINSEKEARVREEERAKTLLVQIQAMQQDSMHERSMIQNKSLMEKDTLDKVYRLQNERSEFLSLIEDLKQEKQSTQDQLRALYDKLLKIKGLDNHYKKNNTNIIVSIDTKIDDIASLIKELQSENSDLNSKNIRYQDMLKQREQELQEIIEDNELLQSQINKKSKSQGLQTDIDQQDMLMLEEVKEQQQERELMRGKCLEMEKRVRQVEYDNQQKEQEIMILTRGSKLQQRQSITTASDLNNQSQMQSQMTEEVVSRLNAKITQMKVNEEQMLQELNVLRSMDSKQQYANQYQTKSQITVQQQEQFSHYESLILDQRQQILVLCDQNTKLQFQVEELQAQREKDQNSQQRRIQALEQLKNKQEELLLSSQQSFQNNQSSKSTAVETERIRQFAQQMELNAMQQRHLCEEQKEQIQEQTKEIQRLKDRLYTSEHSLSRLSQDLKLAQAGLTDTGNGKSQEMRKRVKHLEGLLVRAKQDISQCKQQDGGEKSDDKSWVQQRQQDLIKTNERLRREHHQSISALISLKEEYSAKLLIMSERQDQQRHKLVIENSSLHKRVEQLTHQIGYMEKKEAKLWGQMEQCKSLSESESRDKEQRTKELEELLFKKEETLNDLLIDLSQKDKLLQDRQEQLALLIATLESENSQDEQRQKLVNFSAELCQMKAVINQSERKVNEVTHQLKKLELQTSKTQKLYSQEQSKTQDLQSQLKAQDSELNHLSQLSQDLQLQLEEKERDINELKFKQEREQMQSQMKEESNQQLREQIKRGEQLFKQENDRIRKEMNEQIQYYTNQKVNSDQSVNKTIQFKTAVQQLHLVLLDFLNHQKFNGDNAVIQEFEKALTIASQTIEKLQSDLDKQNLISVHFQADMQAQGLNKVLIVRQEGLQQKYERLQSLFLQREDERETYIKNQEFISQRIIKEQELKIQSLTKEVTQLEEENGEKISKLRKLTNEKEDLEQSLLLFNQEIDSKKLSMEKQAELTIDERFKSKYESIKSYFDSNITRILLNTNHSTNDKILELGRELVAVQIQLQKSRSVVEMLSQEKNGLEVYQGYLKEQNGQMEAKVRESQLKYNTRQSKLHYQDIALKMSLEKQKAQILSLEKELLQQKDLFEQKSREISNLMIKLKDDKASDKKIEKNNETESFKDQQICTLQQQVEEMQQKIMELRAQNIQEMEDLRSQYELDIQEQRRQIAKEKEHLEKRFMPGFAPGDLMEQNQSQSQRIHELKQILDRLMQENAILRKKCESQKFDSENQRSEIQGYKQALNDLESTMIEMTVPVITQQTQSILAKDSVIIKKGEESKKKHKFTTSKRQNSLHFAKDQTSMADSDYNYSHSKINHNDQSSLNVSTLTQMNMINNPQAQQQRSMAQYSSNQQQRGFSINPPQIVKALVQSKVNEQQLKKKCEDLTQTEIELRQQIKEVLEKRKEQPIKQQIKNSEEDLYPEIVELRKRLIDLEIENEDLKINKAKKEFENRRDEQNQQVQNQQYSLADHSLMIETIISLINTIAQGQTSQPSDSPSFIEESQRLVIRSLSHKLGNSIDEDNRLQYVPFEQQDRKLWYLELLEQQVQISEQVITNLQSFIKKLSIDISGNLQSAAQIKAASMDLAQNTMKTADEVKSLRHIIGLIKHDLNKQQNNNNNNTMNEQKTINPFEMMKTQQQNQWSAGVEQEMDQIKNQLLITDKVKKTLEQEIVTLKLSHAQEQSQLQQKLSQTLDQRNSLLQTNEELHEKVSNLQRNLADLKAEIDQVQQENTQNQTLILEKERDRQLTAQTKQQTSKHLQKLQQDMTDWRKQTDDNMRMKNTQIEELTVQTEALKQERDKLKSEVQMLRRNEKDRKAKGQNNEEVKRLEQQNKDLIDRLNQEIINRKSELEFWITERATMREMIDQLENDKVEGVLANVGPSDNNTQDKKEINKKLAKKIKKKDVDIKIKDKQLQECRDELNQLKLHSTTLSQQLRALSSQLTESEERLKHHLHKNKELELERDLILAERNNAIESNDLTGHQIQAELNSLRECFAKLKVERDNLLYEIDSAQQRENEWRDRLQTVNEEMQHMEKNLISKERDQSQLLRTLEQKNTALINDLKYLKSQHDKMADRTKQQEQQEVNNEQKIHQEQLKQQQLQVLIDEYKRQVQDINHVLNQKDALIKDFQSQLLQNESQAQVNIQNLRSKLDEVKEANGQIIRLYEAQIEEIKNKMINDKKKTEQQIDQMLSLTQREAVIKNLKKELTTAKALIQKLKLKSKELKSQITQNNQQENNQQNNSKPYLQKKKNAKQQEEAQTDPQVFKLAQQLLSQEGFLDILEKAQKVNSYQSKCLELESEQDKNKSWIMLISQQLQDQQKENQELKDQMESIQKISMKESKVQKQSQVNTEQTKQLKSEIKSLTQELESLKQTYLSPEQYQQLQDKNKDLQAMIKTLKEEIQRKKELIEKMKGQKEQTEVEATQIIADMEGLKDDNIKLQKLLRDTSKSTSQSKDLKLQIDQCKIIEKKLKDEVRDLTEKMRIIKLDSQRKDQIIKEYKDKLEYIQDEVSQSKDRLSEIERLKDLTKKLKLESELKENQVKTLKQKIEQLESERDSIKQSVTNSQAISMQSSQQMENQVKTQKNKARKYESYLKKCLEAIRKIGQELSNQSVRKSMTPHSKQKQGSIKKDNPMQISEFEKDFYKDSVNILGVSLDELEEFMNPQQNSSSLASQKEKSFENQQFIQRIEKAIVEIPDSLNQDIDQICNYCVKLINEMGIIN